MKFYQTLNVLDDIVQIILEFEGGKCEQGDYPTDDRIEEIRVKCRCEEYIEVSALKGDNLEKLTMAICKTAKKKIEQDPLKRRRGCTVL